MALSAKDLLPNYEALTKSNESHEDIVDDLSYDVFNLMACNFHPIQLDVKDRENVLLQEAKRATQLLLRKLVECNTENSEIGQLLILPSEISTVPRSSKIPEPKPETKWEKFAKEKGIKKKKRDRMVFDEQAQEYKPRYGYKRAKNGIEDIPIVEVKAGQDPYADPWEEARKDKKERVKKNTKQQLKNQAKAMGKSYIHPKGYEPATVPGIPVDIDHKTSKRGKEGVRKALQLVQHSTASMGRYDEMRDGEPMRKMKGKKRSFKDNLTSGHADKDNMKAQLRIVEDKVDKKARGVTNSLSAYEGIIPDAPTDAFKQKKGKSKAAMKERRAERRSSGIIKKKTPRKSKKV